VKWISPRSGDDPKALRLLTESFLIGDARDGGVCRSRSARVSSLWPAQHTSLPLNPPICNSFASKAICPDRSVTAYNVRVTPPATLAESPCQRRNPPETISNSGGSSLTISGATVSGAGFSASGLTFPYTLPARQRKPIRYFRPFYKRDQQCDTLACFQCV
jgi:hypothetical protein